MNIKKDIASGIFGTSLVFGLSTHLQHSTNVHNSMKDLATEQNQKYINNSLLNDIKSQNIYRSDGNYFSYYTSSFRKQIAIEKIDKVLENYSPREIMLLRKGIELNGIKNTYRQRSKTEIDSMAMFGLLGFIVGLGFNDLFLNKNKKDKQEK